MKRLLFTLSLLITLSWSSALSAQSDCLSLRPDHAAATTGETVCIDVKVENFKDVLGMQFSLRWDDDVLAFEEVKNFNLNQLAQSNFGVPPSLPEYPDLIRFFWFDPGVVPQTLSDGTSIFTICFKVIGEAGSHSPIVFETAPTDIEISIGSVSEQAVASAQLYSGSVSVGSAVPDLPEISLDECPILYTCSEVPPQGLTPNISGGTPPYAYDWTGPNNLASNGAEINDLVGGTYFLKVTDAAGATAFAIFELSTHGGGGFFLADVKVQPPQSCDGSDKGSISFGIENGSGEYEFLWSDGSTLQNRNDLDAGVYSLTVTDLFLGCSITQSFTIIPDTGDPIYRFDKITDVSCGTNNTGAIELSVAGAYDGTTVVWNTGATGTKITGLAPGLYTATVTTTTGCTFEWQGEVMASDLIEFSATVEYDDCGIESGNIQLELPEDPANFAYTWSNGATTKDLSGLEAGVYEVTVTHLNNGCIGIEKFEVWNGEMLTASNYECIVEGQTLFAKVSAVVWDGGAPPYTFTWSTGEVQADDLLSSTIISQPGAVTVTITDSKGCSTTMGPIIPDCGGETNDSQLSTAVNYECIEDEFGETTQAEITYTVWEGGTPPYTFSWSSGEETINNQQSSVIVPADGQAFYYVTITDQNGLTQVSEKITPVCELNGPTVTLDIGEGFVDQAGGSVCLPVTVQNFDDIIGLQFTMSWDPTQLVADSIVTSALPGFTDKNYNLGPFGNTDQEGILILSWTHFFPASVSLPDGSSMLEVCFTSIGDDDITEVAFSQAPAIIEVLTNDQVLPVVTKSGSVIRTSPADKQVWPGDTDNNGLVDHFDLLNIGLAFGAEGYSRPDPALSWEAQFGAPWSLITPNTEVDYRHIDTDGNGAITANDTLALALNYGLFNEFWDGEDGFTERDGLPESARSTGTPLYVETYPVEESSMPVFDVMLGDEAYTDNTVYGLAFSIDYDPVAIVPGSIKMSFSDSWLGQEGVDLLTFYRVDTQNHKVNVAMTRTDGVDITGTGAIAQLLITIEDVIFRSNNYDIPISIENARLITSKEEIVDVIEQATVITVASTTNTIDAALDRQIKVYPVPVKEVLYLQAPHLRIRTIELYDLEGRKIRSWNGHPSQLPLQDLVQGTYALRLITDQGVAVRRVVIMN